MASTVTAFEYDRSRGTLKELQTISTLPAAYSGASTCAEIQVHAGGGFVAASNRGHDSLAVFAIDSRTGKLTAKGIQPTLGRTPRHFTFDPSGNWLLAANQDSDNIVVFRVDTKDGSLSVTGKPTEAWAPVCILFDASK
jgi:6-phosphogluconolactonase